MQYFTLIHAVQDQAAISLFSDFSLQMHLCAETTLCAEICLTVFSEWHWVYNIHIQLTGKLINTDRH